MQTIQIKRRKGLGEVTLTAPSTIEEAVQLYGAALALQLLNEGLRSRILDAAMKGPVEDWKPVLRDNPKILRMVRETESFLSRCTPEEEKEYLLNVKSLMQQRQQ